MVDQVLVFPPPRAFDAWLSCVHRCTHAYIHAYIDGNIDGMFVRVVDNTPVFLQLRMSPRIVALPLG